MNSSVADPGCLSRIPDPDFFPSRIPDPGSQKTWGGKKFFFLICFLTFLKLSTLAETDLDS